MGVRILHDSRADMAALYCSTSGVAFGPVFDDTDDHDADERAEAFLRWLDHCEGWWTYDKHPSLGDTRRDARRLTDAGLERAYGDWLAQEETQWQAEQTAEEQKQEWT